MAKFDIDEAIEGLTNEEIRRSVTMTTERHFGTILDSTLGEYANLGFKLERFGANILVLYFKDKRLASYNRGMVTTEIIQEGCKNYMASLARSA